MNSILQKDMEDIFSRNNSWERLEKSTVLLTGAYGMLASLYCSFSAVCQNGQKYKCKTDCGSSKQGQICAEIWEYRGI